MYTLTSIREWSRVYVKIASSRMVLIKTIKMFSTSYALSNDQGILLLNIDPRNREDRKTCTRKFIVALLI